MLCHFLNRKKHFCGKDCLKLWQKTRTKERNGNWNGGKVKKTCEVCNKPFKTFKSYEHARFCSQSCWGIWHSKHNKHPNGHKSGPRKDLNNIFFRSRWEANFARYLNYIGAKWQFEPKTFQFIGETKGVISYLPDFYLPKLKLYVEIKGHMDSRSRSKLKKMEKYYPDVEVYIIMKKEYDEIQNEYANKIDNWEFKDDHEELKFLIAEKIKRNIKQLKKADFKKIMTREDINKLCTVKKSEVESLPKNWKKRFDKDKNSIIGCYTKIDKETFIIMRYDTLLNLINKKIEDKNLDIG